MDVKTLCLGVLTEGDKTGYEIKRCFEEAFSHFFGAGFGSIYPALAELSRLGLVTCRERRAGEAAGQEGLQPDRRRASALLIDELLTTPPRHKVRSEFLVLMYFAHLLPPDAAGRDHRRADRGMGTGAGRDRSLRHIGRCGHKSGHAVCAGLRAGRDRRGAGLRARQQGRPRPGGGGGRRL